MSEMDHMPQMLTERIASKVVWSPKGDKLAVASFAVELIERSIVDVKIEILDAETRQVVTILQTGGRLISGLAWRPNNIDLYTADFDGVVRRWSTSDNQLTGTFQISDSAIQGLSWNPEGTLMVCGGYDNAIRILNATGEVVHSLDFGSTSLPGLDGGISWSSYSPDGLKIVTSSRTGTVIIWDATTLVEISRLPFQYTSVAITDWSPDGNQLATTSDNNTAQIWNVKTSTPQLLSTLQGHFRALSRVKWNPGGDRLATAGLDGRLRIWNAKNGRIVSNIQSQYLREIWRVDWSSTDKLAIGGKVKLDPFADPAPLQPPVVEFPVP